MREIQTIPTENPRHITKIRLGRLPDGIFSRVYRESIPVDPDVREGRYVVKETPVGGDGELRASKKSKAAKVGVRSEGAEVGEEASLQQSEKDKTKEKIRQRKRAPRGS